MDLALFIGFALFAWLAWQQFGGGSDSITDLGGYVDSSADPVTMRIAEGIARAEGFYVPGSRPARNHNPGDMTADLIGRATGKDGNFVVYGNDLDGWRNLYAQVNAWLNGTSHHANSNSTISQVASFYTTTDQAAWAKDVAEYCGVSVDDPLSAVSG